MARRGAGDSFYESERATHPATSEGCEILLCEENEAARRGLLGMLRRLRFVRGIQSTTDWEAATVLLTNNKIDLLLLTSLVTDVEVVRIGTLYPEISILLLVRGDDSVTLAEAAKLPVDGFIMEAEVTVRRLGEAILGALSGDPPVPSPIAKYLLLEARKQRTTRTLPLLTRRELEVLGLLAEGLSNKEIARELKISQHGARRHVANLLAKMNAPNRTAAAIRGLRDHLI